MWGLTRLKTEGAPIHPDELDWECDLDECFQCALKYEKQLEAYNKWEKEHNDRSTDIN